MADLNTAKAFIESFNYQLVTIQIFKKSKYIETITAHPNNLDYSYLETLNKKGSEIFFMVNEGDGIIYEPNKTARSNKNVNRLTSLFLDTDSTPLKEVQSALKALPLKPHLVVESSPKKYHLYFFLRTQSLPQHQAHQQKNWKQIQKFLAGHTKTDPSVQDASRLLRVPGFYHLKNPKQPHLTRVAKRYDHEYYSLHSLKSQFDQQIQLYTGRKGSTLNPDQQMIQNSSGTAHYQLPDRPVDQGSRHHQMTSMLGYLLNQGVDPEVAKGLFLSYAQTNFTEYKDFLPDGKRYHEIQDFIDYKIKDLKESEISKRKENIQLLLNDTNPGVHRSPFELPDSFYINAPNIIGDITAELSKKALYPIPALNFAQSLAAIGTIKAQNTITEYNHPPCNYFLCLAPSGAGKAYAQRVISHTFSELRLQELITTGVRSDKGIARFLEDNNSTGLIQLDESEDFFKLFSEQNTPHHLKAVKETLLQIYSAHDDPYKSLGRVGDKKDKPIVLKYPKLNFIAYGVNHLIQTAFTQKAIADGLLQRFIIISTSTQRTKNKNFEPPKALNSHIYAQMEYLSKQSRFYREKLLIKVNDLQAELADEHTDIERKAELSAEIAAIHSEAAKRERQVITFDAASKRLYEDFEKEMSDRVNKENKLDSGYAGLFTRAYEQVGRLLAVICDKQVSTTDMDYVITFMRTRTEAMYELAQKAFSGTEESRYIDDLQRFIAQNSRADDGVCVYRDIARHFKVRDTRKLKMIISEAVEAGLIEPVYNYRKEGSATGRTGTGYKLGDIDI